MRIRRLQGFLVGSFALILLGGNDPAELSRQHMDKLLKGLLEHEVANGLDWPASLDEIKDQIGGDDVFKALLKNPLTGADPGYEYVAPKGRKGDKDFATQVVLYQLRRGKRDTTLKVGFADGAIRLLPKK